MSIARLKPAPRQLDPSLEKKLIKAMIGITCEEERFQFRQWLLSVNAIVQKRSWRSIFDLDQRNWLAEFAIGVSAESMAMLILDDMSEDRDDPRLQPEQADPYQRERPPIW